MYRLSIVLALIFGAIPSVFAQNPADLTFTLAPSNGRAAFRMGEAINLEFRFSSATPGRYELEDMYNSAKFIADPADGVVSPYGSDYPAGMLLSGPGTSGPPPRLISLTQNPVIQSRQLNTFFSFRKPGRYRIVAETDTVGLTIDLPRGKNPIHLRSNIIEIEIVTPESGWLDAQLKADLERITPWNPVTAGLGQRINSVDMVPERDAVNGVRALSLLETREAAMALVDFYGRGWPLDVNQYVEQGLRRSPYPKDIVAAMGRQLELSDFPVTEQWIGTMYSLAAQIASRPPDYAKFHSIYIDKLAAVIDKKQGAARNVSLRTLEQLRAER